MAARTAGIRLNHVGDEQPPAEDARPLLPTEIEHLYPPTHAGSTYQPMRTGRGEAAAAGPSYTPAHARPADEPARAERADPAA